MQQKSKLILATLSIGAFLIMGFIIFNNSQNTLPVANIPHPIPKVKPDVPTKPAPTKPLVTTSSVTGDNSVDSSINAVLNEELSENDLTGEFSDTDSKVSTDEENLNQINNLSNENEL